MPNFDRPTLEGQRRYEDGNRIVHLIVFGVRRMMSALPKILLLRLALVISIAIASAAYTAIAVPLLWRSHGGRSLPSDLGVEWFGSRELIAGRDAYTAVGPGRAFDYPFGEVYPAPALLLLAPVSWLPLSESEAIFVAISAGLLAWALTRERLANPQLLVYPSFAFIAALQYVQWSPLLTAAAVMPSLGFVFAAKPTIGAALFAAYPSRRIVIGCAVITGLTVLLAPSWPVEWWTATKTATQVKSSITLPFGWVMLLAATKWRRADARLLLALAVVPHTPTINETVPLFLIVRTLPEGLTLMTLTTIAGRLFPAPPPGPHYDVGMAISGIVILVLVYLPCLVIVLRRPNVPESANTAQAKLTDVN